MSKDRIAQFIDWIFKGTTMLGQLSEISSALDIVRLAAAALDAKQDLVLAKVAALNAKVQELTDLLAAGGGVDQAELAAVLASVSELKVSVESASVKADSVLV